MTRSWHREFFPQNADGPGGGRQRPGEWPTNKESTYVTSDHPRRRAEATITSLRAMPQMVPREEEYMPAKPRKITLAALAVCSILAALRTADEPPAAPDGDVAQLLDIDMD